MSQTTDQAEYPFCTLSDERIGGRNTHSVWIRDGYPISPGHSLVISKRNVASFFEVTTKEREALFARLDEAKAACDAEFRPGGYNLGINDGSAAGHHCAVFRVWAKSDAKTYAFGCKKRF